MAYRGFIVEADKKNQKNMHLANQMWKDAFLVKKTKLALENPNLSDLEIEKKTIEYFKSLNKRDKAL
jgi:SRSO17 transposase